MQVDSRSSRLEMRRARDREASKRSRKRKKDILESLTEEVKRLSLENETFRARLQEVDGSNLALLAASKPACMSQDPRDEGRPVSRFFDQAEAVTRSIEAIFVRTWIIKESFVNLSPDKARGDEDEQLYENGLQREVLQLISRIREYTGISDERWDGITSAVSTVSPAMIHLLDVLKRLRVILHEIHPLRAEFEKSSSVVFNKIAQATMENIVPLGPCYKMRFFQYLGKNHQFLFELACERQGLVLPKQPYRSGSTTAGTGTDSSADDADESPPTGTENENWATKVSRFSTEISSLPKIDTVFPCPGENSADQTGSSSSCGDSTGTDTVGSAAGVDTIDKHAQPNPKRRSLVKEAERALISSGRVVQFRRPLAPSSSEPAPAASPTSSVPPSSIDLASSANGPTLLPAFGSSGSGPAAAGTPGPGLVGYQHPALLQYYAALSRTPTSAEEQYLQALALQQSLATMDPTTALHLRLAQAYGQSVFNAGLGMSHDPMLTAMAMAGAAGPQVPPTPHTYQDLLLEHARYMQSFASGQSPVVSHAATPGHSVAASVTAGAAGTSIPQIPSQTQHAAEVLLAHARRLNIAIPGLSGQVHPTPAASQAQPAHQPAGGASIYTQGVGTSPAPVPNLFSQAQPASLASATQAGFPFIQFPSTAGGQMPSPSGPGSRSGPPINSQGVNGSLTGQHANLVVQVPPVQSPHSAGSPFTHPSPTSPLTPGSGWPQPGNGQPNTVTASPTGLFQVPSKPEPRFGQLPPSVVASGVTPNGVTPQDHGKVQRGPSPSPRTDLVAQAGSQQAAPSAQAQDTEPSPLEALFGFTVAQERKRLAENPTKFSAPLEALFGISLQNGSAADSLPSRNSPEAPRVVFTPQAPNQSSLSSRAEAGHGNGPGAHHNADHMDYTPSPAPLSPSAASVHDPSPYFTATPGSDFNVQSPVINLQSPLYNIQSPAAASPIGQMPNNQRVPPSAAVEPTRMEYYLKGMSGNFEDIFDDPDVIASLHSAGFVGIPSTPQLQTGPVDTQATHLSSMQSDHHTFFQAPGGLNSSGPEPPSPGLHTLAAQYALLRHDSVPQTPQDNFVDEMLAWMGTSGTGTPGR